MIDIKDLEKIKPITDDGIKTVMDSLGTIKIDFLDDGTECSVKGKGGIVLKGILVLMGFLEKTANLSKTEVMYRVFELYVMTDNIHIDADSKEQFEVMKELLRRNFDGLTN